MAEIMESKNFIHAFIEEDIAEGGRYEGKTVHTRFPPEPNGYLHIGHCKALIIDFGTAEKFGGLCNLRMDVTNPTKEDVEFVEAIKECLDMGVQVGLMVGAGNFWRGVKDGADKMQRSHADAMGMLGTVMNSIAVADALEKHGVDARVLSAVEMHKFCEYFTRDTAHRYLNEGKVVIFAAGTGNPYFSTDTGVVLRGVEIEADAILMAKNVDAIYSADPNKDPGAVRYSKLTYREALDKNLKATDITAMALAMDNDMTMVCFGLDEENSIVRVVRGEEIGTTVKNAF